MRGIRTAESLAVAVIRRFFLAVAVLLFLGLAWTGIYNGVSLFTSPQSAAQKLQALVQIAFGVFALLGVVTAFRPGRIARLVLTCFAVTVSVGSGMFVVVWSRSSILVGILTGAMAFLIAWAIIRLLRTGARDSIRS